MKDKTIDEEEYYSYDYSPNELTELSIKNREKYERIVNSNLEPGDTIDAWHERNRKHVQGLNKE